jgi:hypothetical protein
MLVANSALHPALRHMDVRFEWGIYGASDVILYDRRYQVVEDRDVTADCGLPAAYMSMVYQMMTFGRFPYGLAHLRLRK